MIVRCRVYTFRLISMGDESAPDAAGDRSVPLS